MNYDTSTTRCDCMNFQSFFEANDGRNSQLVTATATGEPSNNPPKI